MKQPEVAIVGAGLAGCAIAYALATRGAQVEVFSRDEPGRAASWAAAGMLAPFSEVLEDTALLALCRDALGRYPAYVAELLEHTGVDARLRGEGTLHVAPTSAEMGALRDRAGRIAALGGRAEILDRAAVLRRAAYLDGEIVGGIFVHGESQVDNRRLGRALVSACVARGVRFTRDDEVTLEADARRVRGLRTKRGFIAVPTVVNAAGAWAGVLPGVPAEVRVPVHPIAGEMLALAVPTTLLHDVVWGPGIYLVAREDGRLLVGATVVDRGFDGKVTAAGIQGLLAATLAIAPALGAFALVETWAGFRPASPDGRPYLGRTALEGYFVAAGQYRNGVLLTPAIGEYLAVSIRDRRDPAPLIPFGLDRGRGATDPGHGEHT